MTNLTKSEREEFFMQFPDVQEMLEEKKIEVRDNLIALLRKRAWDMTSPSDRIDWYNLNIKWRMMLIEAFKKLTAWNSDIEVEIKIKWMKMEIEKIEALKMKERWKIKPKKTYKNSFDIEQLKAIPISHLLGPPLRTSGDRGYYKCCLHEENTPSFTWYIKQNGWYCFGCGVGGTTIDLAMKKEGMTFIEAAKHLNTLI